MLVASWPLLLCAGRAPPRLRAHARWRGGGTRADGELLVSLARSLEAAGGGAGLPQYAQDSGAAFARLSAAAAQPYVEARLAGAPLDASVLFRDLQLTSLLVLVGALFRYQVIWRAGSGQPVPPRTLRTLTLLLVANALRVLLVNLFVPLSAAARAAFHADADWWLGAGGTVLQLTSEPASGLDLGKGLRKVFMTWLFTQGIADLVNEAPPAIRDVYVAATR